MKTKRRHLRASANTSAHSSKVTGTIRLNGYEVISRALEEGIDYGYARAHKYVNKPDAETMKEALFTAISNSLCEVLIFENPE